MKSKSKVFLVFALGILFLSCSNLFQAKKGNGSVSIQIPQVQSLILEQKLELNKEKLLFVLKVSNDQEFSMTEEALSGETVKFELEAGVYYIDAVAYDSSDTERKFPLYRCKNPSKVAVAGGETSNVSLVMKRVPAAEFNKNVLDKTSGQYNYSWGGNIVKYYPEFNKDIKRGDCSSVTFKGIANTAFKGTINAAIGRDFGTDKWTEIAKDSNQVEFKVGDEVTLSFNFMADEDAKDRNSTQFYLSYEKGDCDDVMAFNEYSIEFNFKPGFTRIEHTIHVADRDYPIYTRSNIEYVLPDDAEFNRITNNHFSSFTIEGYYTDKNFTGSKVTKLTAEENTQAKDFYAKLILNMSKNVYGAVSEGQNYYNYCGSIKIKDFAKGENETLFRDLPQSGETLYFTFEGTAGKDFEGELGCDLIEDSVEPVAFDSQKANLSVKKGEKFTVYYELTVPADKNLVSFEHTSFKFFYEPDVLNEAFTVSDTKITLYGGKYGKDYKPLMIDISVVLPEYKTGNISISQTDTAQGIEFACIDDELTAKGIKLTSFDWILSYMNEDERLSSEKSFVYTKEAISKLEYNGFYALSVVAHDSDGNMYAETAYFVVKNDGGKLMQNEQKEPVLVVTLPSDSTLESLEINQSATENGGTKFTVLNLPAKYEYCVWTFDDEEVSRGTSFELTAEAKAKLEQKRYVLSLFVKEKDGTYYNAEIYINIIK